jgi:hypothetical protein
MSIDAQESITTTPEKLAQIVISAMRAAGYGGTDHNDGPVNRKLLTPRDIRREFGIHNKLLAHWRRQGVGPAYITFGRRIYYERPIFEKFVAAGRVQTSGWVAE